MQAVTSVCVCVCVKYDVAKIIIHIMTTYYLHIG